MSLMGGGPGPGCTPTPHCWWVPNIPPQVWSGQRALPGLGNGATSFLSVTVGKGGPRGGAGEGVGDGQGLMVVPPVLALLYPASSSWGGGG